MKEYERNAYWKGFLFGTIIAAEAAAITVVIAMFLNSGAF